MSEIKWIKISVDMFNDEKIKLIEAMPESDTVLVIWVKLLTLAGKLNSNGYIFLSENIPYTDEMLATVFGRPLNSVRMALETFSRFNMIEWNSGHPIKISNWDKHQSVERMKQIKEQNRLRKTKQRFKKTLIDSGLQQNKVDILTKAFTKYIDLGYENETAKRLSLEMKNLIDKGIEAEEAFKNILETVSRDSHGTVTRSHAIEEDKKEDKDEDEYKNNVRGSDNKTSFSKESAEYKLAHHLFKQILENNPDYKKPNLQKWSDDIRKMIQIDKRDPKQIKQMIKWSQNHDFWHTNLLSVNKLRKQFDTLAMQMRAEERRRGDDDSSNTGRNHIQKQGYSEGAEHLFIK